MLVVAHEQHVVGNLRIGRVGPAVVVEGHGKNHRHPVRREGAGKLGEKVPQILLRARRQFFEVDGQPLKPIGLEEGNDVFDARCSCRGVGEQPRQSGSIPFSLNRVLDHRQDRYVRLGLLNELQHAIVDLSLEFEVRAFEADPARDNPVEVRQRLLQSRVTVVVPVHVEADAQRPLLRSSERRRNRMTVDHLGLRVASPQPTLPLPQIGGELGSCF